ncbi:MAG: hypothetical protein ACPG45_11515, partial [Flavobacteriaceae bacterium]
AFLATTTTSFAQVGVGTTNPLQELHIAGTSSTIRIDGLNSANNTNNNGIDIAPVAVNALGDLQVRTPIYGDNIQSVILPNGSQNITSTSLVNITGATITFTPRHSVVYLSFTITGYNPLTSSIDPLTWFSVGVTNGGVNVGNFLSLTGTTDDVTGSAGAASITAANFPLTVTPGVPVTIRLRGRNGGINNGDGFTIDRTNYTSYMTILD